METQELVERGGFATLVAPECRPNDREGRLAQAERALAAFAPVFQPLAIEIERCWRETDTGLPSPTTHPQPAFCIITSSFPQEFVTARPTIASPPAPRLVRNLDREAIASCLGAPDVPPSPNLQLDWRSIQTIAGAVRSFRQLEEFKLRPAGKTIRSYEPGWFAGPVGKNELEVWPPAELLLRAEDVVVLMLNVYWSGWRLIGTRERTAFETGIAQLESAGWRHQGDG